MDSVTIVIPVYNEELFISDCLKSVLAFKIPQGLDHEIWALDGGSSDDTVSIIRNHQAKGNKVTLIHNPGKTQSHAMNLAVSKSNSNWIMRLDGHSIYPPDYLVKLYTTALESGAANVGGIWDIQRNGETLSDYMVHSLITHPFGVGNSGFRTGMKSGLVDTVPYGFFKREIFETVGLFDERLIRAQDYEFNRRLIKYGFQVWLNPEIHISYFPKGNIFQVLKKYTLLEAPYNAYMWYLAPYTFSFRHIITIFFILGLIGGAVLSTYFGFIRYIYVSVLVLYSLLALSAAMQVSIKNKKFSLIFLMPLTFFIFHILHGFGVLGGLIRLMFNNAPVQKLSDQTGRN